jgi:glycosyltransferase involved in cell wall biosynthesis
MHDIRGMKVSIIIPVYNVEKYLAECLDSAVGQTHQNKEIIIVNDGSTDGSADIISSYQEKYSEIVFIATENRGQSSARNTGLDTSTGDYLIFLDSDDWLEKETLERCLLALKEHDADIVMFNAHSFADEVQDFDIKKLNYTRAPCLTDKKLRCREAFALFIRNKAYLVSPCLYLYKRSTFNKNRFQSGIIHEDNLFTTQLLINSETAEVICLPDRFFHRRVRPGSIMTKEKSMKHVSGYLAVAEELLRHELKNQNCSTAKALNQFIQGIIGNALATAQAAFDNKIPLHVRNKSLRLFLKTNLRHINPRAALICFLPEIMVIKRKLHGLIKHP